MALSSERLSMGRMFPGSRGRRSAALGVGQVPNLHCSRLTFFLLDTAGFVTCHHGCRTAKGPPRRKKVRCRLLISCSPARQWIGCLNAIPTSCSAERRLQLPGSHPTGWPIVIVSTAVSVLGQEEASPTRPLTRQSLLGSRVGDVVPVDVLAIAVDPRGDDAKAIKLRALGVGILRNFEAS